MTDTVLNESALDLTVARIGRPDWADTYPPYWDIRTSDRLPVMTHERKIGAGVPAVHHRFTDPRADVYITRQDAIVGDRAEPGEMEVMIGGPSEQIILRPEDAERLAALILDAVRQAREIA